jgi:hypothetical protein
LRLCGFGNEGSLPVNKYFREWLFCSLVVGPLNDVHSIFLYPLEPSPILFYSFLFFFFFFFFSSSFFIITIYFDMVDLSYNREERDIEFWPWWR